jgi:hypothetical protein
MRVALYLQDQVARLEESLSKLDHENRPISLRNDPIVDRVALTEALHKKLLEYSELSL